MNDICGQENAYSLVYLGFSSVLNSSRGTRKKTAFLVRNEEFSRNFYTLIQSIFHQFKLKKKIICIQKFYKLLVVMVFWFSMMPNSLKKNFLNQESKKTLYFYSKILPKSLILGWSIPRFSRLFSSRGIPRQQIPRFLVSHEEIRSVVNMAHYLQNLAIMIVSDRG